MNDEEETGEEYEDLPEDHPSFVDCTCEHLAEEHDYMHCDIEGCPCIGRWEE